MEIIRGALERYPDIYSIHLKVHVTFGYCDGEMKKICNKVGVSFENAVTDFNKTYNEGYKKLEKMIKI